MDNLSDGNLKNVTHLKNHKAFRFVKEGLRDAKATERIVAEHDGIFYLAAQTFQAKGRAFFWCSLTDSPVVLMRVLTRVLMRTWKFGIEFRHICLVVSTPSRSLTRFSHEAHFGA